MDDTKETEKVEELKKQFAEIIDTKRKAEEEFDSLKHQLQADLSHRKNLDNLIKNDDHKNIYNQLCVLNEWLLNNNINISAAEACGKLWFCHINEQSFKTSKPECANRTPEYQQAKNFVDIMQSEWIEEYCIAWDKANNARLKFKQISKNTKDDKK